MTSPPSQGLKETFSQIGNEETESGKPQDENSLVLGSKIGIFMSKSRNWFGTQAKNYQLDKLQSIFASKNQEQLPKSEQLLDNNNVSREATKPPDRLQEDYEIPSVVEPSHFDRFFSSCSCLDKDNANHECVQDFQLPADIREILDADYARYLTK